MNKTNEIKKLSIPNDLEPKWTPLDKDLTYECQKCGYCCRNVGFISLSSDEIEKISTNIKKQPVQFLSVRMITSNKEMTPTVVFDQFQSVKDNNLYCMFLKNKRCSIYNLRPSTCQAYPFTIVPFSTHQNEFSQCKNPIIIKNGNIRFVVHYDKRCKGFGKGSLPEISKIEDILLDNFYKIQGCALNPEIEYGTLFSQLSNDFMEKACDIFRNQIQNINIYVRKRKIVQ